MTDPVGQLNFLNPLITILHSTYTQLGEGAEGQLLDCSLNSYTLVGGVPKDIQQSGSVSACVSVSQCICMSVTPISHFPSISDSFVTM